MEPNKWTVVKLVDGKLSIRHNREELYILEAHPKWGMLQKMLNQIAQPKQPILDR